MKVLFPMRIVAICATIALLANASPSASDAFDFASVIHIEPAVGAEHRGFHFVVTTLAGQKRVAWGAAIRGELVAVDFSTDGEPSVLYNRQDPGPSAQLFQSRTIHWLPGGRVGGSSPGPLAGALATTTSGVFVVSNRGMELINATIPSNPATLAVVNFSQPTSAHLDSGDDGLALNGLALLEQSGSQAGTSQLIMVGAAMSGSLCASQIDVNTEASTDSPITMSKFGTWVGPLQSAFDIDIFNSSQFGRLLVVVSPHGGTLLTVVSVTSANDRTRVLPTAQWSVHSTVANPAGWPANTGCNRVRVHPAGYAFVSCFDAALNNVMVIDLTLAQPKIIKTFPYVDEQPTGMLVVNDVLFVAGGRDLMAFDISNPANTTILASCGQPCGKIMTSSGQNAHSLDHYYDSTKKAHFLALTAQIDNNLGVVRIMDPFITALLEK